MNTKTKLLILAMTVTTAGLLTCSGPSAPDLAKPEYNNPYDERGHAYIPTPDINTVPVTGIRALRAESGGQFETDYGKPVTAKGVCWSTGEGPTITDNCTNDGQGHGAFTSVMGGLEPDRTYYVRAYATNEAGTIYGGQREFQTMDGKPELLTHEVQEIRARSARVSGEVYGDGGANLMQWGICYSEDEQPTTSDTCLDAVESASHKLVFEGKQWNTNYMLEANRPKSQNTDVTNDDQNIQIGSFSSQNSGHGVAYNHGSQPNEIESVTKHSVQMDHREITEETDERSFDIMLEELSPGHRYYARTFAINEARTSYGSQVSFTTRDGMAVVTTNEPSNVTALTAKTGGQITDDGGTEVTVRGVCWAVTENPNLEDTCEASGSGKGIFEVGLNNLDPDQTYYVRAYGTTGVATSFGAQQSFTTTDGLAIVTTAAPWQIRAYSALAGGQVTDQDDAAITDRGVCYSTEELPTIGDSCIASGEGEGGFEVLIDDLDPDRIYYVRAYAVNKAGMAYGGQEAFTTRDGLPVLTTTNLFNIRLTSAKAGGNITDDGGTEITERGVCYSTVNLNPTTHDDCVSSGSGTGSFEVILSNLEPDLEYHVRTYAQNEISTGYGNNRSFKTLSSGEFVEDIDGNIYPIIEIGNQIWMTENLQTSRYQDGSIIPNIQDNGLWSQLQNGAWAHYENDSNNEDKYGKLYNWYAVANSRGLCPVGWHVPSDNDWTVLVNYVISQGYPNTNFVGGAGNTLKSRRQVNSPLDSPWATSQHPRWNSNSTHYGTDKFGFSGLPAGSRNFTGPFNYIGDSGEWWSSSESSTANAWRWRMTNDSGNVGRIDLNKQFGLSVRCLRND